MYVIIVGCGRVGSQLARLLVREGHNVVVVDKNPESFKSLGATFNGLTVAGNGFDIEVLKSAGIEEADAFCALTDRDTTNLISAQVAKKIFGVSKVVARVYDPQKVQLYQNLGLQIISGTVLFAAMIRDKLIEEKFSSYLLEAAELATIELKINSHLQGKRVKDLNIPSEFLIVALISKKGMVIPQADTLLQQGDRVFAVVKTASFEKIKKRLKI